MTHVKILGLKGLMETENGDSKSKMEDYAVIEQIGRGAFGATFLVLHKPQNKKYVLKKIRLSRQTEKFKRTAYQEMNLIAKLRHPYILEYKDVWVDKGSCICIVTDYCEVGNISQIMRKTRGGYFPEEKLCKWLTQLLLAIDYLHSNRVLHRDIKLSNIFLTKENDIHLGDFGLAKLLNEEGRASSVVGTPNYICPELLADTPYGYKSDIWSLGCCIFEIAAHHQAFRAPDMTGLINKINRSLISPLPIVYSSTLKQIMKSMLRKSPEHRPTAAELLRHPHLQPFLLRCHNPSTVFLPVKSPSPKNTNEKSRKPSPGTSAGSKDSKEREMKPKQRDLLPLFEENTDAPYPSLLDDDISIEEQLETKRVDRTSYLGEMSHDSEDSKSGDTSETTACNGDGRENYDSSSPKESLNTTDASTLPLNALPEEQDKYLTKQVTKLENPDLASENTVDSEPLCSPSLAEETEIKSKDTALQMCSETGTPGTTCSSNFVSLFDESVSLINDKVRSEVDAEPRSSSSVEENTGECSGSAPDAEDPLNCQDKDTVKIKDEVASETMQTEKEETQLTNQATTNNRSLNTEAAADSDGSKGEPEIPGGQRAHALESLLELCARLLKQDKYDELSGVLKPFGDDTVSSRETAIWLTKSLMNAQKFAKES
ncbi:UNVERIFIED_CONTAM: Serine/threonine-protein kinase Nek6 [Sesamum calycinum]|uniref:Serine/threonine-protein kinase Nek6 n=1 Tax=Sesamum calycinum TaxID=2727403 RepID=A0AAW2RUQ4_9LAMI